MEVLAVIGIIVVGIAIFTGGGILGWLLKGLGAIINFLLEGWNTCLGVIGWIIIISFLILALTA